MIEIKHGLTIIILTRNEKDNIEACISSAKFADEIIVVDSGSEDNTRELAEKTGARVFLHPFEGFAAQRNFGLKQVTTDWVMYLDADERITQKAAKQIQKAVERNEQYYYDIKRVNFIFGQKQEHGAHRPDYPKRLFPTDSVTWEGVVHESPNVNLHKKRISAALEHHTYSNWEMYFEKFNQYTTLMADKMKQNGKKASLLDMTIRPLFAFFRAYVIWQGFRDGLLGFIMSVIHAQYTFTKYVKLYYKIRG